MKIDLHCHTKQVKSGDGAGRNVTPKIFRQKIIDADVKIVAITNHNAFDYEQYQKLADCVSDVCQVWPGIEIDIAGIGVRRWHLIVVANPDNVSNFSQQIQELFDGKDLETCAIPFQDVYDRLNDSDVIYILHFHKKPAVSEIDIEELRKIVNDDSRIFNETPDHRSLGVFANYDYNVLIGSDVKDWTKYEESTFAELRLPVSNFSQFCLLAKRDAVVVDTLLNSKKSHIVPAYPHSKVKLELRIYEDVNIIFGQKGTGKSEILNSLYLALINAGLTCEKYTGSEKESDFSDLLKTKDMELDLTKVNADSCEDSFAYISSWSDSNPTLFSKYISWYETKDNNSNKKRMKLTESSSLHFDESVEYKTHRKDWANFLLAAGKLYSIELRQYLEPAEAEQLCKLITLLEKSIFSKLKTDVIEEYSYHLANFSIEHIKAIADKNSDTVSKPSSTGFIEFAQRRLALLKHVNNIQKNISVPEKNEFESLGTLDEKGAIYICKKYRMLCDDSKAKEYPSIISSLKEARSLLSNIHDSIFADSLPTYITSFNEICSDKSFTSSKAFLGVSKQIVTEDKCEYSPSNGERGILLLQQKLSREADAYFLDEPELGMGNSYIDSNIRPIISDLAKRHKIVVVATHNANLAVRTLPYMSIFRAHKNGDYFTYTGNPFNDALININDSSDFLNWTVESMHTLEGGKEAFYERKNIYESNSN